MNSLYTVLFSQALRIFWGNQTAINRCKISVIQTFGDTHVRETV